MFYKFLGICGLATLTLNLVSCSSGSASAPSSNANYGYVESIIPQTLNNATQTGIFSSDTYSYAKPYMLGVLQQISGSYLHFESNDTIFQDMINTQSKRLPNEISNIDNTKTLYNYNPMSSTTSSLIESVSAFSVLYRTPGQDANVDPNQTARIASGLVMVPNMVNGQKIRGIMLYFHGTVFAKNEIPSCLGTPESGMKPISANPPSYCNLPDNPLTINGIDTFGSFSTFVESGFIVVAPDYVGLGADYNNMHPYAIFPIVNAKSGLYMLPAVRQILESYGYQNTESLPLFITGYSEGGAYAVVASQLAQYSMASLLDKYNINMAVTSPLEGAYSLQDQMQFSYDTQYDGVFSCPQNPESGYVCGESDVMINSGESVNPIVFNMNKWHIGSAPLLAYGKILLLANVQSAAVYYIFDNMTSVYNYIFSPSFWNNIPVMVKNKLVHANLSQMFGGIYGPSISSSDMELSLILNTELRNQPYNTMKKYPFNLYDKNSSLAAESILEVPLGANNQATIFMNVAMQYNPIFSQVINDGAAYNWVTKKPIHFIHLAYDSVVTVINSYQAVSCMTTGKSFVANESYNVSSSGQCTTAPSNNQLISQTIIPNFQISNNMLQMQPLTTLGAVNTAALSKFLQAPQYSDLAKWHVPKEYLSILEKEDLSVPFDHLSIPTIGNIIALCTFNNYLNDTESGANNPRCQ